MKYPLENLQLNGKKSGEEKYRVLREKERSVHTGTYNLHYEEGTIVVALVQNHYLKVIQSLMHTVAGLLLTIPFLEKLNMS
jgi:hypothetical protein